MDDNRENLWTIISARRKAYLWVYFAQTLGWLVAVIIYEAAYAPREVALKHAINTAVTMSFIAPGVFISTVFLVEVAYDSAKWLIIRGGEFMGLLFTPARNKYVVLGEERGEARGEARGIAIGEERGEARGIAIGEERGEARGEARTVARFADWLARKEQAEKEGKDFTEPPPFLNGNSAADKDNAQR